MANRSAHISTVTPVLSFILGVLGWLLFVLPGSAEAAATGSVRFEFVDAVTGDQLDGFVVEGPFTYVFPDGAPRVKPGVSVGEHTYGGVVGKYGGTIVRVAAPGEPLTVSVAEGVETLVRFEMTPPGRFLNRLAPSTLSVMPSTRVASAPQTLALGSGQPPWPLPRRVTGIG